MSKRQFFLTSEEDDIKFEWIGKGEKCNRVMHYTTCSINDVIINTGDTICVKQESDMLAVGKLLKLFESCLDNPHRATVKWYFTYDELPKKFKVNTRNDYKNELYEPLDEVYIGSTETIDAETISNKCEVVLCKSHDVPVDLQNSLSKYFLRYGFGSKENSNLILINDESRQPIRDNSLLKTPTIAEKKIDACKSAPAKHSQKLINRKPLEPLANARSLLASPKRKGSDSIYKTHDNHAKLTKLCSRNISFNTAEAVAKLMDSEDEDLHASDTESLCSNASDEKKIKLSEKENAIREISVEQSSKKSISKKCYSLRKEMNEKSSNKDLVNRRRTVGVTEFSAVSSENDVIVTSRKTTAINNKIKLANAQVAIERIPISNTIVESNYLTTSSSKTAKNVFDFPSDDEVSHTPAPRKSRSKQKSSRRASKQHGGNVDSENITQKVNTSKTRKKSTLKQTDVEDEKDGNYVPEEAELSGSSGSYSYIDCDDDVLMETAHEDEELEASDFEMTLSKKKKKAKVKTEKIKNSPFRKTFMTPGIVNRTKPRLQPKQPLEFARQKLHVSAVPDCLPCREDEFEDIYMYVCARLQEGNGGCMYISGVPGTGKTATVHEVIKRLQETADGCTIPYFKFVEINGMKLTDPNQAYCTILKLLTGHKATSDHAASLLEKRFSQEIPKKEFIILLVDELDLLWTRKQNVMYNLFEWPTRRHSKLVILAVANTMDLPERIMMNRVSSRLGLTRMTFQPYTFRQLQEIVLSRIKGIDAFEEDALQLVARKVAAVSGDARRCLDICRRAVEIAESSLNTKSPRKKLKGIVGMKQVELALKEMFSSPKILALQSLSEMQKMFVKAVVSEFRRTGLEEALFMEVYDQFCSHCRAEGGYEPPNSSQAFGICNALGACRLLLTESGSKDIYQRVRLNVNTDDVMFAFKVKK